jgi:hypothetical protein
MSTLTRRLARRDPPRGMGADKLPPGMGAKRPAPRKRGGAGEINRKCTAETKSLPGEPGYECHGRSHASGAPRLTCLHYTKGYRSRAVSQ